MSHDPSKHPFEDDAPGSLPNEPSLGQAMAKAPVEVPDLSASILAQLSEDIAHPLPCQYDTEFLSAYLDGQLANDSNDDPTLIQLRITAFEKHLPQCLPCNRQLGLFSEVIRCYRQHLYALETQLETVLDVSSRVLHLHRDGCQDWILDETRPAPQVGCGQFSAETLCAVIDGEADPEAAAALDAHAGGCPPCTWVLALWRQLTVRAGHVMAQPAAQTPADDDLWPAIAASLSQPSNVLPFPQTRRARRGLNRSQWLQTGLATVAAGVLVLMLTNTLVPDTVVETASLPKAAAPEAASVDLAALQAALSADEADAQRRNRGVVPLEETTSAVYTTPEAYLFSSDDHLASELENMLDRDVSAFALRE